MHPELGLPFCFKLLENLEHLVHDGHMGQWPPNAPVLVGSVLFHA